MNKTENYIKCLIIEINSRKVKWLLCCLYNPNKTLISKHLHESQRVTDHLSQKYKNMIFMGDYNVE